MHESASLYEYFTTNSEFYSEDNVFFQKSLPRKSPFENQYIGIREKESRVYADDMVRRLPDIDVEHTRAMEWKIRKHSADRLIQYLKTKKISTILEVGCGNGWLTNYIHRQIHVQHAGVDVNETELKQAARVSQHTKDVLFIYADVLQLSNMTADVIILGSCLQYFPDVSYLLSKLQHLLSAKGEIHVFDSPLYTNSAVVSARARSVAYFESMGFPEMADSYFHHTYSSFEGVEYEILYNPNSLLNRAKRLLSVSSPFPWIRIKAN